MLVELLSRYSNHLSRFESSTEFQPDFCYFCYCLNISSFFSFSLSLVFLLPFEMLEFFSSVCHQLWAVNFKCDCVSDIFWVYHQVQLQHTAREPDILDSTILLWNRWNVYLNERSELRCCARTMWLSMLIYPYRTGFYNVQFGLGIQFFRTVFK